MVRSVILDEAALEQIVTGYGERGFELVGFEMQDVTREENKITWVFVHEAQKWMEFKEAIGRAPSYLGSVDAVHICCTPPIPLRPGDRFIMTYILSWEWRSREGDDYVCRPFPTPGAELHLELVCAA